VVAVSFNAKDKASMSFAGGSAAALDRAMNATFRSAPGEPPASFSVYRSALESMTEAALRAVGQWQYAPPADGPIAFDVNVAFGPPPPPPPPPPAPVTRSRPGLPPPPPPPPADTSTMADGALRVGGDIKPPVKLKNVNPAYPPDAQAQRVQGVVIIEARVEPDGTVGQARILRSIPMLDDAALDAVRQWEFTPTLLNGQPVPVIMTVTVNFTLQ
jgi:TonB family protein